MSGTHSPLPWRMGAYEFVDADLRPIASCGTDDEASVLPSTADMQFIVRACNAHYQMLAALKELCEALRKDAPGTPLNNRKYDALAADAFAAIALAEGRQP